MCVWRDQPVGARNHVARAGTVRRHPALLRCGATTVRRCCMSTLVVPLALGVVGVGVIVVVVVALAGLVYELLGRGNPRQDEVDAEREQVTEQIWLDEPVDFESDLRPPREP